MKDDLPPIRLRPPLLAIVLFLLASLAVCGAVYSQTLKDGFDQLSERAEVRLAQHNDKFLGQITRFQQLVATLARHPELVEAASTGNGDALPDLLLSFALATGASEISLTDAQGQFVVSSSGTSEKETRTLVEGDHIKTALDGGLGWSHGLESAADPRTLYFARAIFDEAGPVIGAVAVSVAVASLEFEWSFGPEPLAYFDNAGVAFVSNRPSLALRHDTRLASISPLRFDSPGDTLRSMFDYQERSAFGHRLWQVEDGAPLPSEALVLSQFIPRVDLTGYIFQDTKSARERANLITFLSGLIIGLAGLLLWVTWLRRQTLARQLRVEEAANIELEERVARRTAELKNTQDQLVAVSRLSALGEMSAGISHELNQPLGAIRNFAENGKKLIQRGDEAAASENFDFQIGQVDRIGRIIKSLRAFAKNEPQQISEVEITSVVREALDVSDLRINREAVEVKATGLEDEVSVDAGRVRLQQVIVNILGNAMDAIDGQPEKTIDIDLATTSTAAVLSIRDSGPGLEDPERVFDPFYSTKDPGGSSGMGLGLAISHGIIGSFGGTLSCRNRPNGGAEFTITLPLSEAQS
ncbi:MAG: ATP-binding protein [Boseongicola sp.]|nr:ATP-binding protein [Boseongicola sp.]